MLPSHNKGYDAAEIERENDDLDRWRLAAEIVEVILATPPDWSARIGIFGKWGEGKTTVLRFAEHMLRKRENITFRFSPWAIQSLNDLWEEFGGRLHEALTDAKIPIDTSWKKFARESSEWLQEKGVNDIAESALGLIGKDKLYHATFGAISRWLKYDGAQIREIREKLGSRRIVVLIDDLDRCAPNLLPQLLLSLRELLDLPGFTFVLAFDDEIISRTLNNQNPAWTLGQDFLEKILDFRFYLPAITEAQKRNLVGKAVQRYCAFVPLESIGEVLDLLPSNPRKLKTLVRSMAALRPQVERHDADELNWVDMWLAQLIKVESYPFFERLLEGDALEHEVIMYQLFKTSRETEDKDDNKGLSRVLADARITDTVLVERLTFLIEAARSRASQHFKYIASIAVRPHALTWKEFRSLCSRWERDGRPEILANWINEHAAERGIDPHDVEEEVFDTMIRAWTGFLSSAAESASTQEHDSCTSKAAAMLGMLDQYLFELTNLSPKTFRSLYGQTLYWIGFRKNPTDVDLRGLEESLVLKAASSVTYLVASELIEIVAPGDDVFPDMGDAGTLQRRQMLREKCLAIIEPKASKAAVTFLKRDEGVYPLTERNRFKGVKCCLFDPSSSVWKSDLRNEVLSWIRKGREDAKVYVNVRQFFNLLVGGLKNGLDSVAVQNFKTLLLDQEFVMCLWQTIISRSTQYRLRVALIHARQSLIDNGTQQESLPMSEELEARLLELRGEKHLA